MSKKSIFLLISLVLSILFIFMIYTCKNQESDTIHGLKSYSGTSSFKVVYCDSENSANVLDKAIFSYSFNVTNENKSEIFIQSVHPEINESIKDKILSIKSDSINKYIDPKETVTVKMELTIDAKDLQKIDLLNLEIVTGLKISTDQIIKINPL